MVAGLVGVALIASGCTGSGKKGKENPQQVFEKTCISIRLPKAELCGQTARTWCNEQNIGQAPEKGTCEAVEIAGKVADEYAKTSKTAGPAADPCPGEVAVYSGQGTFLRCVPKGENPCPKGKIAAPFDSDGKAGVRCVDKEEPTIPPPADSSGTPSDGGSGGGSSGGSGGPPPSPHRSEPEHQQPPSAPPATPRTHCDEADAPDRFAPGCQGTEVPIE